MNVSLKLNPIAVKRHQTDVALQNFNMMLFLLKGELLAKRFLCHMGVLRRSKVIIITWVNIQKLR